MNERSFNFLGENDDAIISRIRRHILLEILHYLNDFVSVDNIFFSPLNNNFFLPNLEESFSRDNNFNVKNDIDEMIFHENNNEDENNEGNLLLLEENNSNLQKIINYIPSSVLTKSLNNKNDFNCIICLDVFYKSDEISTLPCMHIFHTKCIIDYLNKTKKILCPVCKFEINLKNLIGDDYIEERKKKTKEEREQEKFLEAKNNFLIIQKEENEKYTKIRIKMKELKKKWKFENKINRKKQKRDLKNINKIKFPNTRIGYTKLPKRK